MYPALLIDTSNRYLVFGRVEAAGEGSIIARLNLGQNEDAIDHAVAEYFPDLEKLSEVWLGSGPGSFVGLRSSYAYVRMLTMLMKIPCRTFFSSLLWRAFFDVAPQDWFLTRTNAKLFYADRFPGQREALAVEYDAMLGLTGKKYCFAESWVPQSAAPALNFNTDVNECRFEQANFKSAVLDPALLQLSGPQEIPALTPLYGHELNFALKK